MNMGSDCISPQAFVSKKSKIGKNTIIEAGSWIGDGAIIGNNCLIEYGACVGYVSKMSHYNLVEYETQSTIIEDGCLIAPGSVIYISTHLFKNVKIRHNVIVRENVEIREGTNIGNNAIIHKNVKIGKFCSLHNYVEIADYSLLGDYIFIGPGFMSFNDNIIDYMRPHLHKPYKGILIKDKARIGGNVTMFPGSVVGEETVVGAVSTVYDELDDRLIYMGNPARPIKKVPKEHEMQNDAENHIHTSQ